MKRSKALPLTETTYYILLALLEPAHGYLIIQKVEELSDDTVRMAAGTMYGALENLVKLKFIQLIDNEDKRRKVYQITESGKDILNQQYERYVHIVNVSKGYLMR